MIIADPATASAALQNGEVDWLEVPLPDLVPTLRKNRNVTVDIRIRSATSACLCFNHLYPPFNDVRARRAILMAMSQEDYMRAFVGDDDKMWKPLPGYLHARHAALHRGRRRNPQRPAQNRAAQTTARGERLCGRAGHLTMAAQDMPHHKAWGDVTADLLKRLGMKVDYAAVDWGTVVARRAQKTPPGQGGWQMFPHLQFTASTASTRRPTVRANGEKAFFGWPNIPQIEAEIAAWYDGEDARRGEDRLRAAQQGALDNVIYAPLGVFLRHSCLGRKNVSRHLDAGPAAVLLGRRRKDGVRNLIKQGERASWIDEHS